MFRKSNWAAGALGVLGLLAGIGGANAQTADWAAVSVTCTPDDPNSTMARYDALATGVVKFQNPAVGNMEFWCDVQEYFGGGDPTWDTLVLTNLDTALSSYVQAVLYRKSKTTGATAVIGVLTSTDAPVVKADSLAVPAISQADSVYFVRVQIHRDTVETAPEFHIVGLRDAP